MFVPSKELSVSKVKTEYRITVQDADGNFSTEVVKKNPPKKGDSFEYLHTETRVATVTKVERIDTHHDGATEVSALTEIGDAHHALEYNDPLPELPEPETLPPLNPAPPFEPAQ